MTGKILPKSTMLLRQDIGSGEREDGRRVTLFTTPAGPGVQDEQTGRLWVLGWTEIVDMAVAEFDNYTGELDAPSSLSN